MATRARSQARNFDGYPNFYPQPVTPTAGTPSAQIRRWLPTVLKFFRLYSSERLGFLAIDSRHGPAAKTPLDLFEAWAELTDEELAELESEEGILLYQLGFTSRNGVRSFLETVSAITSDSL